jgi:hypothetical protein
VLDFDDDVNHFLSVLVKCMCDTHVFKIFMIQSSS